MMPRSVRTESLSLGGVSFEEIASFILKGDVIDEYPSSKHPKQRITLLSINSYIWVVVSEIREDKIRLITVFPSRKIAKKIYEKESHT